MKKIQAIVKLFKLDEAKQALAELKVVGMTEFGAVSERAASIVQPRRAVQAAAGIT
jgi:nitrogen regulatory protein PII